MIHGILFVHFTCLTIHSDNLSPGSLRSSSWSWTLNFILHTFLHPVIIIFSQHMHIPTQPVLLQNQCYGTWKVLLNEFCPGKSWYLLGNEADADAKMCTSAHLYSIYSTVSLQHVTVMNILQYGCCYRLYMWLVTAVCLYI